MRSVDGVPAGEGIRAGKFIVMVTKQGVIKKCELTEFDNPLSRGIIALGMDEGDELLAARLTTRRRLHLPGLARRHGLPLQGRATSAPWAAPRAAFAAWNSKKAITWSASKWSTRKA